MSSVEALGNEHIINGQKIPTTGSTAALKRSQEDTSLESGIPAKRTAMYAGGTDSLVQMGGPFMGGQSDSLTELYPVPENTVGLVIGKGGSEIQNIQSQSGCRVQMSPDADNSGFRQVTLQGQRGNIDKAKAMIQDVVMRAQQRQQQNNAVPDMGGRAITIDIPIPPNKCGLIIGKQGETIRQLQEQSGCKMMMIQATQEVTGSAKPLRVTGDPEKIEIARRLVDELVNKEDGAMGGGGGGGMPHQRQQMHGDANATARGEVVVPRSSVGMIIGKGGETIKRLAVETGTKIQFKPDDDPNSPERCALIMGTRDQIYRATELITELVNKSNLNSNQQQEVFYMHIPAIKTGLVIGKGGETIKQINQESGAHCELSRDPPPNPSEKVFMIRGTPSQIHHAQHIIRIKVGDIPPNTPVPIMAGQVSQQPQIHAGSGGYQKAAQPYGGQYVSQPQQPQQPAWNTYGSVMPNAAPAAPENAMYGQSQYYGGAAQPAIAPASQPQSHFPIAAAQYQQPAVVNAQPYAQPQAQPQQAQATPAINPSTGQTDYSAQWAEYYRSVGLLDQAAMVESQMKQNAARAPAATGGVAAPYAQYQGSAMPAQQPAAQPVQPYAQYQAAGFPQTGQFQPGQPQQF